MSSKRALGILFLGLILCLLPFVQAEAQEDVQSQTELKSAVSKLERDVSDLESDVSKLKNQMRDAAGEGLVLFLFGAFCALWAQNTGRSAWGWFFLGCLFSVFTVIALLIKNSEDRKPLQQHEGPLPPLATPSPTEEAS